MRRLPSLLLVLLLLVPDTHARRRSTRGPAALDPSTAYGWLAGHAYAINAIEPVPWNSDLEPLGQLIGNATVVGLGDGTHGTHEFYTIKLRAIEYLVRERGFDVVTFEAPVAHWEQLNDYVLGGAVDPRVPLADAASIISYGFWNTEEILALLEWMREYNLHRGNRPPLQILGTDVHGQVADWKAVVAYLRTVDPAMAADAESEYACIGENNYAQTCRDQATRVRDAVAAARDRLIAASTEHAYEAALLAARAAVQAQAWSVTSLRDQSMAENVLWIRDHRSATGRVLYWAHDAHVAKAQMEFASVTPAGLLLENALGDGYFILGTMTAGGTFTQWIVRAGKPAEETISTFPALADGMYEGYFKQRGLSALLVPLHGELPQWLIGPARWNMAGNSGAPAKQPISLPAMFDAVLYIEHTTPIRTLR
jgi:erythromycin esterase